MKIKKFYFQNAKYLASDEKGNAVYLQVDYKNNSFEIEVAEVINRDVECLVDEASTAAKCLLARKHGVNMISRLESALGYQK